MSTTVSPTLDRILDDAPPRLLSLYLELTKARLSALVLLTTAIGYVLASTSTPFTAAGSNGIDWLRMLATVIGTACAAGCANALNQVMESRRDLLMERTRNRPVPAGHLSRRHATLVALILGAVGMNVMLAFTNLLATGLTLLTILIYVLLYTPLKTRTTLNTFVGAVVGAIPPMIGWCAAVGRLDAGAWMLGALLFVWQLPHFLALAWMYRDDYAAGGFRMLPNVDHSGHITGRVQLMSSLVLIPLALSALYVGLGGWLYAIGAVALGLWMAALSVRFYLHRTHQRARHVFLASLVYLPAVLVLLMADHTDALPIHAGQPAAADVAAVTGPVLRDGPTD